MAQRAEQVDRYVVRLRTGAAYGPFDTEQDAEQWRAAQVNGFDARLFANAEIVKEPAQTN